MFGRSRHSFRANDASTHSFMTQERIILHAGGLTARSAMEKGGGREEALLRR